MIKLAKITYRVLERTSWFQPLKKTSENTWDAKVLTAGVINITIKDELLLKQLNSLDIEEAKKIIFQAEATSYIDNRYIYKKEVPENRHFINNVLLIKDSLTFKDIDLETYFIEKEPHVINNLKLITCI